MSAVPHQAGRVAKRHKAKPIAAAHTAPEVVSGAGALRYARIIEVPQKLLRCLRSRTGTFWKNSGRPCWPRLCLETVIELVSARVVRWLKAACATMSVPRPIFPPQAAKTLANGLAVDLLFCDVLASLHLHLQHKVDLEGVVEIRDL
jgi:hypothetical protein